MKALLVKDRKRLVCFHVHAVFAESVMSHYLTQDINESANSRFLQRLPSYLASAGTVRDLLLPVETTVHEKWLPAETVHVILLPAETLGSQIRRTVSAGSVNWRTRLNLVCY